MGVKPLMLYNFIASYCKITLGAFLHSEVVIFLNAGNFAGLAAMCALEYWYMKVFTDLTDLMFLATMWCLDLTGDSYTFGRGEMCDYQFSTDCARINPCYQAYSKVHFKVAKVMCSLHAICYIFYTPAECHFRHGIDVNSVTVEITDSMVR